VETNLAPLLAAHPWIIQGGYIAMFIMMLLEGPVITAFGGLAAAIGIFDVRIVFLFSILGNFIPDVAFYGIGYWGRTPFIRKYGFRLGVTEAGAASLEKFYREHSFTTLLVVKLVPLMATPGLIAAGVARMPFRKYSAMSLAIILVTSGIYLATGYYSGTEYIRLVHYQVMALACIGIMIVAVVYGFNRFMGTLGKKLRVSQFDK